jgi:hypothetical protein
MPSPNKTRSKNRSRLRPENINRTQRFKNMVRMGMALSRNSTTAFKRALTGKQRRIAANASRNK